MTTPQQAFEAVIARLRKHFRQVDVRPPASPEVISELQALVPGIPPELLAFYRVCNGIVVPTEDHVEGHIYSAERTAIEYPVVVAESLQEYPELSRLIPVRCDGCGDHDCVVAGPGIGEGAVVFWDHEVYEGPAYLLAGSFLSYLDMWSDNLIHEYHSTGKRDPRYEAPHLKEYPWVGEPELQHPWPFDERWVAARDSRARELLADPLVRTWLLEQDNL